MLIKNVIKDIIKLIRSLENRGILLRKGLANVFPPLIKVDLQSLKRCRYTI